MREPHHDAVDAVEPCRDRGVGQRAGGDREARHHKATGPHRGGICASKPAAGADHTIRPALITHRRSRPAR